MTQQAIEASNSKQTESFNVDLFIALLSKTRPMNEKTLQPIILK